MGCLQSSEKRTAKALELAHKKVSEHTLACDVARQHYEHAVRLRAQAAKVIPRSVKDRPAYVATSQEPVAVRAREANQAVKRARQSLDNANRLLQVALTARHVCQTSTTAHETNSMVQEFNKLLRPADIQKLTKNVDKFGETVDGSNEVHEEMAGVFEGIELGMGIVDDDEAWINDSDGVVMDDGDELEFSAALDTKEPTHVVVKRPGTTYTPVSRVDADNPILA